MRNLWQVLRALSLALALSALSGSVTAAPPRASYVLVHGAWMGKDAWNPVAERLRQQGAEVIQVELPAHGGDRTPAAQASLDGYVNAVVAAIGERRGVILVGHSFGGIVISATAEKIPERLSRLVYVAAYLPRDGESAYSLSQQDKDSEVPKFWVQADPSRFTPVSIRPDGVDEVFCNDCTKELRARVRHMQREEPVPPMGTPVKLTADRFGTVAREYIATRKDHAVGYALQLQMLAATPVARVVTLEAGHLPMLTRPQQLAAILRGRSAP